MRYNTINIEPLYNIVNIEQYTVCYFWYFNFAFSIFPDKKYSATRRIV